MRLGALLWLWWTTTLLVRSVQSLRISEFLASNRGGLQDEDGDSEDWLEIHNDSDSAVDLGGYFLVDNNARWALPSGTVLAGGAYLVVFASDKDRTVPGNNLHTNFRLSAGGEYLALIQQVNGTDVVVDEYAPEYPEQTPNQSYGLDANGVLGFFQTPTPGGSNPLRTAHPAQAFPSRGFYDAAVMVTLRTSTTDAHQIRYTTDGSKPTATTGNIYNGPIEIATTTVLRIRVFGGAYSASATMTYSYFFVDDILKQPRVIQGFPNDKQREVCGRCYALAWFDSDVRLDMEMDPEIVTKYSTELVEGMKEIPTISMVGDLEDDIFGDDGFFFTSKERELSIEVLYGDTELVGDEDQINAGVRRHSWDRLKPSFRFDFRSEYGNREWNTKLLQRSSPFFGDGAVDEFRSLILRGGNQNAWTRVDGTEDNTFTTDQFVRDTQIAVSGYGSHGTFTHVYLNGVYWGLYNLVERPDNHFAAAYFGEDEDDYFFRSAGGAGKDRDAGITRFRYLRDELLLKDLSIETNYLEVAEYLDIDWYRDYIIVHFWAGVTDWPEKNYYVNFFAGTSNVAPTPLRFFTWDAEMSLNLRKGYLFNGNGAYVIDYFIENTGREFIILQIWHALFANEGFRNSFAARVDELTADGGPLSDAVAIERWDMLNAYIEKAVIGESARWGDALKKWMYGIFHPDTFERDGKWFEEVDEIRGILQGNAARLKKVLTDARFYGPNIRATQPPGECSWGLLTPVVCFFLGIVDFVIEWDN